MATTTKILYSATSLITISVSGLADNGARESTAIDNTSNLYIDAMVQLQFPTVAGIGGNSSAINIYGYGSTDGTNYQFNATGSDAAITMPATPAVPLIGVYPIVLTGVNTQKIVIPSVAQAFGGNLPLKWGIIVENKCGMAVATSGSISAWFTGIQYTSV